MNGITSEIHITKRTVTIIFVPLFQEHEMNLQFFLLQVLDLMKEVNKDALEHFKKKVYYVKVKINGILIYSNFCCLLRIHGLYLGIYYEIFILGITYPYFKNVYKII